MTEQPSAEEIAKAIVKEQEKAKQKKTGMGCLVLIVAGVLLFTCVALLPDVETETTPVPESEATQPATVEAASPAEEKPQFGRSKVMLHTAHVCDSEESFDELMQAASSEDARLLEHLTSSGRCAKIPKGMAISVLDVFAWSGKARIRIYTSDGESTEVWTYLKAVFSSAADE